MLGSMLGRRPMCCLTSSRYRRLGPCRFMSVHMRPCSPAPAHVKQAPPTPPGYPFHLASTSPLAAKWRANYSGWAPSTPWQLSLWVQGRRALGVGYRVQRRRALGRTNAARLSSLHRYSESPYFMSRT